MRPRPEPRLRAVLARLIRRRYGLDPSCFRIVIGPPPADPERQTVTLVIGPGRLTAAPPPA